MLLAKILRWAKIIPIFGLTAAFTVCAASPASAKYSKEVERVQQILHDKGYNPGPVDGVMGHETRQAIGQYQKAEDLPITQRLDGKTSASLGVPQESVGATFKTAGQDFGSGGKQFGQEISKGKPIAAGKDLGVEVGRGGAKVGQGVAKAVTP